ncbi:cyanobactin maturation protease PatG family protein [Leptothoe spongobia]|uniref:PatG domain-containing protein n=1 Tax=Leptothoe spongobia TAU-MAC 1115 TaxID=1967444 RepID=A0A947DIH4_9CYAN|nr:hypothetical protein [Leptothoe spongobia]MBT9316581.1 hypothetical protein [Leptothoe spongobia TAU-MAC 1115]
MDSQYVYALGTVIPRFPNMGLEKEFAQAANPDQVTRITQRDVQYQILNKPENLYIARDMCWVFSIQNVDTYILEPRSQVELEALIAMLNKPADITDDVDVVIGDLGPIASAEKCNGLQIPIVYVDNTYSFEVQGFLGQITPDQGVTLPQNQRNDLARYVFNLLMQLADNVGNLDEHRAINYLLLRYPEVYNQTFLQNQDQKSLDGVNVQMSRLNASGTRRIVDVIFTYRDNSTDVKNRFYASVDVGSRYPFLVERLQPYYERPSF